MGQQSSGGGGFTMRCEGLNESLAVLTKAGANLHGLDTGAVYQANSQLRAAARMLGEEIARTVVKPVVAAGPAPQAAKMADTIASAVDRKVVIKVGARNPKLSGFKKGRSENRRWRGSLAWGVERGAYPGAPDRYTIPRASGGHAIGPNMDRITAATLPPYEDVVRVALITAGITSWQGLR